MYWSTKYDDIPGITNIKDSSKALQDFNGKANTAAIKAYGISLTRYPAAIYAYEYKTTGTNAGEWYLPALGELNTVYSNKDYMSSSEYSSSLAWRLSFNSGNVDYYSESNYYYVRPVLAF